MATTRTQTNGSGTLTLIDAGFIPLVDCAALAVAKDRGFDKRQGFSLQLHKEVSWANIRDKVNAGLFDCAQMLAPMPLASSLGIGHVKVPMIAPMSLGLNGNAIAVSHKLFTHMLDIDPANAPAGGMGAAKALAAVIHERRKAQAEPLRFGVVYPFSCHNYELRYWLAAAGIDPDADVQLVVIPTPLMAESLKAGQLHGFCVGEPWSTRSVEENVGRIIATKSEIWQRGPEKVLGMQENWASANSELVLALVRALDDAARWLDDPENLPQAAQILSQREYLGLPTSVLLPSLTGRIVRSKGGPAESDKAFLLFHRDGATEPRHAHAIWILSQMIRWGQIAGDFNITKVAHQVYREDLYFKALPQVADRSTDRPSGVMIGGDLFEPESVLETLKAYAIRSPDMDFSLLEQSNP